MTTQAEVVTAVSLATGVNFIEVKIIIDAYTNHIIKTLKKGNLVNTALGTFYVARSAARNGRNPRTGATIQIPAKNHVRIKFNQTVKQAVN